MSREAFKTLMGMLPEPMLLVTGAGTVMAANAACCRLLKKPAEELEATALTAHTTAAEEVTAFLNISARGRQLVPGSLTLCRGDGEVLALRVEGGLLEAAATPDETLLLLRLQLKVDADRRFLVLNNKIAELSQQIRERYRAEAALRVIQEELESRVTHRTEALARINAELRRSNQALDEFAAVASHDLQEPLRKILTFADMLTQTPDRFDEEERNLLERMQQAATRMRQLVQDLLTLSRVSARNQRYEPVTLDEVMATVLDDLEARIEQTEAEVQVETLPRVEADALQMRQLLQNLVGNALKFHRPGVPPQVRVWTEAAEPGWYRLYVADNGIGMSASGQARIFTAFQRLHGRAEYEGTGIGLAICKRIAERHGGTIRVSSTPGEGSTFVLVLPYRQPAEPESAYAGA